MKTAREGREWLDQQEETFRREAKTVRELGLEYGCGYCGQEPGERCITESGRFAYYQHAARYWAVHAAGRLPWQQEAIT